MSRSDISDFNDCQSSISSQCTFSDDSFHSASAEPLDVTLSAYFCDVPKHLNVIHMNAQSIPAHFPDMLASFVSNNIHAILVSETWLKPCLPSSSYSLPGFNLIRNDRIGKGGGGVAIYLRSHLPYKIVSTSPQPPPLNTAEHLLIELDLSHSKILLGVFYSPSLLVDYFASLENTLENYLPIYKHVIFMGDFNTCLLKRDHRSNKLLGLVNSFDLHVLTQNATHFMPGCIPSLLDLMIVSSPEFVAKFDQCPADAFSCHELIYLSYKLRPPKLRPSVLLLRNFGGINQENLLSDARQMSWSDVFEAESIDAKVDLEYGSE
ncbi:unnamed protein product [Colias eurytheme]|nr:unnamed protein product [Colias eurytheme]